MRGSDWATVGRGRALKAYPDANLNLSLKQVPELSPETSLSDFRGFLAHGPLGIFVGLDNAAVAHVDDAVSVLGGLGIVRNHKDCLS